MDRMKLVVLALLVVGSGYALLARGGSLTPPAGPVGPSGPSLQNIFDALGQSGGTGGGGSLTYPPFAQRSPAVLTGAGSRAFVKVTSNAQGLLSGESDDPQYPSFIDVLALDYDVARSGSVGGALGALQHGEIRLLVRLDKTLPQLMQALVLAEILTIDLRTTGTNVSGQREEKLKIGLTSARVFGVRFVGVNEGAGYYELRLSYSGVTIEHRPSSHQYGFNI